ncbi:MAG: hypothetical protein BWY11_00084 [Firmicutes bacterium ADurb.Bin182]|nr:MAG: hypothetical protein BWY11_00084 [Firmicutes bacterium ADurb.Bin182]
MEYLSVVIAAFGSFAALFIFTRLTGNRQMSQLSLFDYISGITIGSIAAEMATTLEGSFMKPFIALAVYTLMTLLLFYITAKSQKIRRVVNGEALILYYDGNLYFANFKKAKMELSEFLTQCRNNGYFDLSKLQAAILESNGKISFLQKPQYRPVEPRDLNIYPKIEKPLVNIILDGEILYDNLEYTGNDQSWLERKLAEKNISASEVFLATCDSNNEFTVYKKNLKPMTRDMFE